MIKSDHIFIKKIKLKPHEIGKPLFIPVCCYYCRKCGNWFYTTKKYNYRCLDCYRKQSQYKHSLGVNYFFCKFCKKLYLYPKKNYGNKNKYIIKTKLKKTPSFCSPKCKAFFCAKIETKNGKRLKTCSKCKKKLELNKSNFFIDRGKKHGFKATCIECDYGHNDPERKKKLRAAQNKWKRKNSIRINEARKPKVKMEVDTLHDNYIRRLIARYSTLMESEIPMALIDAKRQQIILIREIRKRKEL
jgi:hypothetical protein